MTDATADERDEELSAITAIFPELVINPVAPHIASLDIEVSPSVPLNVTFSPGAPPLVLDAKGQAILATLPTDIHALSYLPPLHLEIILPDGYPDLEPPCFILTSDPQWLPDSVTTTLNEQGENLWEEYGRSQVVYAYIDYLQQEAEGGFGLADDAGWELPQSLKFKLVEHDRQVKRKKFEAATFDCGVCLEPKKGLSCYKLRRCGHVFCVGCLQDFYNNAITEGDINNVKCLDPDCGTKGMTAAQRRTKKTRLLHPTELINIPLPESQVQRYVELKLKKKLESDKTTVYCPRTWCQGPAKSAKWAKFAKFSRDNLDEFPESDDEGEGPGAQPTATEVPETHSPPPDRLSICSKCTFAFCRLCKRSWHGDHINCVPRNTTELSAEEKASYDYIRLHTSPCPTCASPCQKTQGCNHMNCFQCNTHFCYLCSAWLQPGDPYLHFNKKDSECYMRLWELEEGDEGPETHRGDAHFIGARGAEMAAIAHEEAAARIQAEEFDAVDAGFWDAGGRMGRNEQMIDAL